MYISTCMPFGEAAGLTALYPKAIAPKPRIDKTVLQTVKLTTLFILLGFLHLTARTTAQQRISIKVKAASLDKIFAEIEKQSGFTVFYNLDVLKTAGPITLDIKDAAIEDVMRQCLKGLPLDFTVQDKTIFVKKARPNATLEEPNGPTKPVPQTLSGLVRSTTGTPLMGATVFVVKLKKSAVTNADGQFVVKGVPDGEYDISITYVGFESYKTKVTVTNHEAFLTADLKQSMSQLDQMVVKGYYNTTNRLNTGNVTTVSGEDINKQPVTDPILALEGRVPGLYIAQTSGVPGSYSSIQIRGQNSILNGNDPLYIVDGVPFSSASLTNSYIGGGVFGRPSGNGANTNGYGMSPFNLLNPAEIESIEILKDADATAIYGSRGANGVILITTKKGKAGATKLDANVYTGAGHIARSMHLLNTYQYLAMRHEAFQNDNMTPDPNFDYDLLGWDTMRYTNWQKTLIGKNSTFTNAQLSMSGGNANTQFILGGSYSKQGVVFPGSYFDQKVNGFLNLTHSSADGRLHTQMKVSYVNDYSNMPGSDPTGSINLAPDAPALYNANGTLNWEPLNGNNSTWNNPLAYTVIHANAQSYNLITNLDLNYEIIRGLHLKANFGYNQVQMDQTILTPATAFPPPYFTFYRENNFGNSAGKSWITEPQITFDQPIWKGKLSVILGTTFQQSIRTSLSTLAEGFSSDELITNPLAASTVFLGAIGYSKYDYDALFGRISYNIEDKYLVNLTGRRDGSSRFGPGKQFGDFGAAGVGWIFSKEKFVANQLSFLSFGKFRASYGVTGNDQIGDYQYLSTYSPTAYTYQALTGLSPNGLTNPNFAWEQVKKLEAGLELGFIKDRILFNLSYFRNRSNNQLIGYPLPSITGFGSVEANLPATVQNTGVEMTLNSINVKSKYFSWASSFNATLPKNKLLAFPKIDSSAFATTYEIGKPLSIQYVYHNTGVAPNSGVYTFSTKNAGGVPSYPKDLIVSKPVTQTFFGGFNNNFGYKGLHLDIFLELVKQLGFNYLTDFGAPGSFSANEPTYVLSRWKYQGDLTSIQQFSQNGSSAASIAYGNIYHSDARISDASFVRLKNLALSYELPSIWCKKAGINSAKFYIQCQNLFTITSYKGQDPESPAGNLPPLRMMTGGIQLSL